jgi:hypothetical protein
MIGNIGQQTPYFPRKEPFVTIGQPFVFDIGAVCRPLIIHMLSDLVYHMFLNALKGSINLKPISPAQ